jgi:cobalt-zinc-cadmium efflux system outer membrane protein
VVESAALLKARVEEMERWRSNAIEELKEAAALADRHYRLGAVPLATYVELQKQYLDAVEAILESKREALVAAQELEILTGRTFYRFTPGRTQGTQ